MTSLHYDVNRINAGGDECVDDLFQVIKLEELFYFSDLIVFKFKPFCFLVGHGPLKTLPVQGQRLYYSPTRTTCTTWGYEHFRTFDNFIYGFSSTCNYVFVSDCSETLGAFNIQIRRGKLGLLKRISINIWGILIIIENAKITVNDNAIIKLPYNLNGIQIKLFGDGTRLATKQKGLDLVATWNNIDYLMVELGNDYRGKTCGLCGDFNGHPRLKEFSQGGKKIPIYKFASKYQLDDPSEMCELMNQPRIKDGLTEYVSILNEIFEHIIWTRQGCLGSKVA
ncbi:mucin-6-like [Leucoraja erinacea]|uniref:mucin-6-like n=1 Tax=Leucoraja erinaceus TaxID=7782 RepID=UPI002453B4BA|nr:mucin-6-like [Leucoraja erinacea]